MATRRCVDPEIVMPAANFLDEDLPDDDTSAFSPVRGPRTGRNRSLSQA